MKKHLRHLFIQLLVAVVASLGIAQAGVDLCPPDCGHCGSSGSAVSHCCDDMAHETVREPVPGGNAHGADCWYGSCVAIDDNHETIAAYHNGGADSGSLLPAVNNALAYVPIFPVSSHSLSLKSPPPGSPPPLYTINCSLLI